MLHSITCFLAPSDCRKNFTQLWFHKKNNQLVEQQKVRFNIEGILIPISKKKDSRNQMSESQYPTITGEAILRDGSSGNKNLPICVFILICGPSVAMGTAAAVPKSGIPPETSPLPATSPLETLQDLQASHMQKTLRAVIISPRLVGLYLDVPGSW